jgi:hypothetical protein
VARLHCSIWLSVLRQPAHRPAAPKCHTPSPRGLPVLRRPASGFAPWQATAQASRSRGWRRHCLAFWPRPATVEPSLSSAKQTIRQAKGHEHPVQHAAEFLDFFWRPNRPLPNMLFKGTPTRCAACRPLTPALGFSNEILWQLFGQAFWGHPSNSDGSTEANIVLRHRAYFHGLFGPSVHKAAGAPRRSAKVPHALAWPAARPSAVSIRFCAVASHSTGSPRSRLRRHRLATRAVCATLNQQPSGSQTFIQEARWLNANQAKVIRPISASALSLTGRSRGRQQLSRRFGNAKRGAP